MASNAGSVATFTGNPQNMLIGGSSGMSYARFAAFMALPALLATCTVAALLLYAFRKELSGGRFSAQPPAPPVDRPLMALTLLTLAAVIAAFFAGAPMSWSALCGAAVVMAISQREPRAALDKVDFILLLFFASLFVIIFGVYKDGWALQMRDLFSPLMQGGRARETLGFASLSLVASNLFSNVPFVMLARHWVPGMQNPELAWQVLALSSTLAGNLTLLGSVANLIVFEAARGKDDISFWAYLKIGVPVTLLSLAVGLAVLLAEHAL
jgi:Na+/H+ antiporter NhaD/arsenite permease-like protein